MELRKQNNGTNSATNNNPMTASYNLKDSRDSFTNNGVGHQTYVTPSTTRKKSEGSWFTHNNTLSGSREIYTSGRDR
jgi:hypothetical protein